MECNKEEAVRAMQLSEMKMQNKDFTGAMKMAQKAQRLFPQLENISQLLTVCEVHCSSKNKIGESDMDWYGILQMQQLDNEATIKKQYRKLALLLHPDKNKFSGAETAFKLIGEANRVLADKEKRSIYDMICRAHQRYCVPKLSAHHSTVVKKHSHASSNSQNMQSQAQPNTFWTICPSCLSKFQYYRNFLDRLLCCQQCRRPFTANELRESVHSESLRNQSLNHKGNPSQGPSNSAPQSNGGAEKGNVTRSQNGDATFKPVSKVGISADVSQASNVETKDIEEKSESGVELGKQGVEMSESGPVKSKDSGTSRNKKKLSGNSTSESSERLKTGHAAEGKVDNPSYLSGGHHLRRSSRNKQNLPSNLKDDDDDVDDDDFVNPPKRLKKGQLSSAAEKEKKDAAAEVRSSKTDMSTNSAANVGGQKKVARPKASFPTDESLPRKRSKTREFELKVMGDTMADKDERNFRTDISPGPNLNVASPPKSIETPDPQFHQFDLDVNTLGKVFRANQTWALYDDADSMPRFYAIVKKVFTPGFKVKIKWLETNPDEQGEIDWCEAELPAACGKFKLGDTKEISDHLMFSHQMHCIKASSGRSSFLVYPRKGETWAIYRNWDIGWSCEPEKHKPYNFEFVEVLSDFIENVGVRVAYLGKIKGFVSLFQRSEQHGVVVFQVPPHELYRFSHRIPSFKMTGTEGYGVPQGSLEFDPASLPTDIFDSVGDLKMDNRNKKSPTNGLTCEFVERVGSVSGLTDMQKEKNLSEREHLISRSRRKSKLNQGNLTQPKGSAIPCQGDNKMKTPKKHQKTDLDRGASSLRRSPRDLSKNNSIENVAVKHPDSADDEIHVNLTQSEMNFSQCNDSMHASVKDHHSLNLMKNPRASPSSSSPDCRLSQTQLYDFKQQKSREKFRLGQIWALYSVENALKGMPTTYALVKRIVARPNFRLHMALLEPCSEPTSMSEPVSCGTFNVKDGPVKFFPITLFSHCVNAKFVETDKFEIKPRKGEVWALCKNPDPKLTGPNQAKDVYEIVQVLEDNDQNTEVVVLAEVKGLKSIYKAQRIQRSKAGVIYIPRAELHRFSHQIPAFQHTWESDKRLSGCWELDELSIPGTVIPLD